MQHAYVINQGSHSGGKNKSVNCMMSFKSLGPRLRTGLETSHMSLLPTYQPHITICVWCVL